MCAKNEIRKEAVYGYIDCAGKYLAAAENGVVSIEETTKPADWSLSAVEMQNRIISVSNLWQYDSLLENSWFPLPFELPNHDMV